MERLADSVKSDFECLVVVDFPDDTTSNPVEAYSKLDPRFKLVVNTLGRGPAKAIKYGFNVCKAPIAVVTMADGSDDPQQVDELIRLVDRGVAIAAASRYMAGGQQVGAPAIKGLLSKIAGKSLHTFARVGTHDATNSYKAYSVEFVRRVGIDSGTGFVLGLEMIAKAKQLRLPVAEVPTIWLEREVGESNFRVAKWLPHYLFWYFFAFGHSSSYEKLATKKTKWFRIKNRLIKENK